jgi:hypothetical protein
MRGTSAITARLGASGEGAFLSRDDQTSTWVHYFGGHERPLFGALHLPADDPAGGVLVCSPVCAEMARNYRREVLLGRALAERGVAVLRFHYWGSGNSGGGSGELGFDTMRVDTALAFRHLRDEIGDVPLGVMGTRLGAVVAAVTASTLSGAPTAFWEPVVDPARYFREVFRARLMTDLKQGATTGSSTQELVQQLQREGAVEIAGYPITRELYDGVMALPLPQVMREGAGPVLVVEMNRQQRLSKSASAAVAAWRNDGLQVETSVIDHAEAWWFGAGAREGAADARVAGEAVVPLTARFLADLLSTDEVDG